MTSSDFLDVALVNMPFASIRQPSFALGLFASSIRGKYKVKTFDFNVDFAEIIGLDLYDEISTWHIVDLLGDRLFAQDLYGSLIPPFEEYVERILKGKAQEHEAPFRKEIGRRNILRWACQLIRGRQNTLQVHTTLASSIA